MQAVRLIRPHPKTYWWKFKEAILAMKMERVRDKRWILSQYLNRAPYGSNFIGIEAASAGWFGKSARQLGLSEAAMLAGMVQAPSRFRPDRGLDRALRRRDYVLGRMFATGAITREQLEGARGVLPVVNRAPRPFDHPYFCDWVLRRMGRGAAGSRKGGDFVTTLNADVQTSAVQAVGAAAEKGGYSVAAVVMRVDTGAVVALACSGDYFDPKAGQVNTALAYRPAGSTLKPFLTALAMDAGCASPGEMLADVPVAFKGYRPANFDARHRGAVSVRDALILSLNVPFVQLLRRTGVERFGTGLRDLGFSHLSGSDADLGLGMAIGNVEVSLVELVNAYATLARGGIWRPPAALRDEVRAVRDGVRICSGAASYLVSDMLSGTERSAAAHGHVAVLGGEGNYGYFDVPGKNIRLFFLDSCEKVDYGFTSEQLTFVAKGLETLPDDGRAVVMQHYCIAESIGRWMRPGQPLTHAKRVRGFGSETLHAIFAAFVHSEAGTRDGVSWNFTGKPQRRLAACFCGDSHFDSHGVLDDVNYVVSQGYGPCHPLLLAPGTTFVWKSDRTKHPMIDVLGVKRLYENIGLARVFRVGDGGAAHDREWCF